MHPNARRNLEAHIAGERVQNLEALMAPLSACPRYVVPGWLLEGRDAVREMYRRALPYLTHALSDEYLRAIDDDSVSRWGEDHIVIEYTADYPLHAGMVVVVHFDDEGRVYSENTYYTNPALRERFGTPSYEGVPGASRL
jgi:hypothetical protein